MKEAIDRCKNYEELTQEVKDVDLSDITISDFHYIARQLKRHPISNPTKVAFLGNFTIAPLPDYVAVYAAHHQFSAIFYTGDYDQYYQEVLDDNGRLREFDPQIIFLALSLRKLVPEVVMDFDRLTIKEKKDKIDDIVNSIQAWSEQAVNNTTATILVCNFPRPDFLQSGIADLKHDFGETEFYFTLNLELIKRFKSNQRVYIFDLEKISARYGRFSVFDPKMYYLAKMEWSEKFLPFLAEEIIRFLKADQNLTKKCLVLDLDNTLWGGVVGEEGPMGIKVAKNADPVSEAYYDFQKKILAIKNRGIILAICSKNNRDDVIEVFDTRKDMPLKKEDFSTMQINWDNKHENIVKIAQILNIGTDSLFFIDDNPAECSLVQQMLPEVKTVCLPRDPSQYASILERLDAFEKTIITKEDIEKSAQYHQNLQRQDFKVKFGDLRSYLESLKTTITIRKPQTEDLNRVHQLFTKTNQFNVTTIRYKLGDIEQFVDNERFELSIVEARDQFGILGTIGVYLVEIETGNKYRLDSFILSCRAMGRGIESAIMNHIKKKYFAADKDNEVEMKACFTPTPKNKPVANFFEDQGFEMTEKKENAEKRYLLQKSDAQEVECGWINLLKKEEYDARKN